MAGYELRHQNMLDDKSRFKCNTEGYPLTWVSAGTNATLEYYGG